ncbi:hypothetical protein [Cellulosilyticum ruminicola]|uniref:hypothetical protein n=1 Tax=Cellulosilyticum ruminicola TaxID=425254 RepID=UPI0012EE1797|nr:hypothetical protein [Cellulosilyticum ruminicola]
MNKKTQGFETATEKELRDVMGGSVNPLSIIAIPVALYAVTPLPILNGLGKLFKKNNL